MLNKKFKGMVISNKGGKTAVAKGASDGAVMKSMKNRVQKKTKTVAKSNAGVERTARRADRPQLFPVLKQKRQGYNDRLDEALGMRNGKKSQSMKARRDESKGMEKKLGRPAYSGNKSSRQ